MIRTAHFKYFILMSTMIISMGCTPVTMAVENAVPPRILVSGQGKVDIAPDMAVLSLSVTREAKTARGALDANSSAMSKVISAMKKEGIASRDLQTSGFSIYPRYSRPAPKSSGEQVPPGIIGYTVRNSLRVYVRDISIAGSVLDRSVTLGVNEGGSIQFTNADPSSAIKQARIKAVQQALAKANTLAEAAGVKTGRLLELSEPSVSPRPVAMSMERMSLVSAAKSVPIATGENSYTVRVNATFAIEQ